MCEVAQSFEPLPKGKGVTPGTQEEGLHAPSPWTARPTNPANLVAMPRETPRGRHGRGHSAINPGYLRRALVRGRWQTHTAYREPQNSRA